MRMSVLNIQSGSLLENLENQKYIMQTMTIICRTKMSKKQTQLPLSMPKGNNR